MPSLMEKYLKQQQQNKAVIKRPERQKVNEKNDTIILQYISISMDLV